MKNNNYTTEYKAKSNTKALDCKNDAMMIAEGIRPDHIQVDRSVFTKCEAERIVLKDLKNKCTNDVNYGNHFNEPKMFNVKLHLINSIGSKSFKTTITTRLYDYVIGSIKINKSFRTTELQDGKYVKVEYQVSHIFVNNKLTKC